MMNKAELLKFFDVIVAHMRDTMERKNSDYAGQRLDSHAFTNFTTVELLNVTDTERGFLTRMSDKFCRIITFVNVGVLKVKDESVVDTLIDLANYSILMAAYIKSKKDSNDPGRKAKSKKR